MTKQRIPNGRYTKEFREEAVKLITEGGLSIPEAGRRLSLASSTIAYWAKAHKAGKLREVGKTYRPLTEIEMELAKTKRELAEVKMERDILKKAAAYFVSMAVENVTFMAAGMLHLREGSRPFYGVNLLVFTSTPAEGYRFAG